MHLTFSTVKAHFHADFIVVDEERVKGLPLAVIAGFLKIFIRINHHVVASIQDHILLLFLLAVDHLSNFCVDVLN
jgi:hypothetical protein